VSELRSGLISDDCLNSYTTVPGTSRRARTAGGGVVSRIGTTSVLAGGTDGDVAHATLTVVSRTNCSGLRMSAWGREDGLSRSIETVRGRFHRGVQPVSRVLSDIQKICPDGHSSGSAITRALKQPTRGVLIGADHPSPLIWPCSSWGLPCHVCYHTCGELLPRRFTLA
jgi:hypothetical protein